VATFCWLRDVAADADGRFWAVGDFGEVLCIDALPSAVQRYPIPTQANLHAITTAPDGALYAVGAWGTILRIEPGPALGSRLAAEPWAPWRLLARALPRLGGEAGEFRAAGGASDRGMAGPWPAPRR